MTYAERVAELEAEGLTTGDAQAVIDAEDANEVLPAPFALGTKVRYPGPEYKMDGGPWVRIGDVGIVVEIRPGLPAHPHVFGPGDKPIHDTSIIEYHGSDRARRAVSIDTVGRPDGTRYEAVEE